MTDLAAGTGCLDAPSGEGYISTSVLQLKKLLTECER